MDLLVSAKGSYSNWTRKLRFFGRKNEMGTDQSRARLGLVNRGQKGHYKMAGDL
jgi:hypothetical protein